MGHQNEPFSNSKIINYESDKVNNSFLDIFLLFGCEYMITDGAGVANVVLMNRKKRLYINFAEISKINISDNYYTPFIMLKNLDPWKQIN